MTFIIIAAKIMLILHRKAVWGFKKALFISIYLLMGIDFKKNSEKVCANEKCLLILQILNKREETFKKTMTCLHACAKALYSNLIPI